MASISFTRVSETTVRYSATGLALNVDYQVQVYSSSNGKWYAKDSFTAERTSMSGTFTVDTSGSYSGRLYDATNGTSVSTATIPAYLVSNEITVYAQCADGVSQFTLVYDGNTRVIYNTSGSVAVTMTAGASLSVRSVYSLDGYGSPYLLYYNTESDPYGVHGPISFTGSASISDTSFDRRIRVGATETSLYPYRQIVYIDDEEVSDTTNSSYSEDSITISDLPNYSYYLNQGYQFDYARVGSSSTHRGPTYSVSLTANTTTIIRLYFITLEKSTTPIISRLTATASSVTIEWSKNGGTNGEWLLYYGTDPDNPSRMLGISSSPHTVTGLTPNTKYYFMIQNRVTSTDKKESLVSSITTKTDISLFSWTTNDTTRIAAGQPVSNLSAASWNALIEKVSSCGGVTSSIPTAVSGDAITANHFNQMRNAIASLSGAGSIAATVAVGATIQAILFANATTALKEAINRAITAKNS